MAGESTKILEIWQGDLAPSVGDTILSADGMTPLDLSGKTLKFNMRDLESDVAVIDGATAASDDPTHGEIHYDWHSGDTDTAGSYAFWWTIEVAPGVNQSTQEHRIDVLAHAPGGDVREGPIARRVRFYLPATYDAMRKSDKFGEEGIKAHVDMVKYSLFGSIVSPASEATTYSLPVMDYVSRVAAMKLIPPAIDWWGDQPTAYTTTGTNENLTLPERRDQLWKLYNSLRESIIGGQLVNVDGTWTIVSSGARNFPVISHKSTNKITADPYDFPPLNCREYVNGSLLIPTFR